MGLASNSALLFYFRKNKMSKKSLKDFEIESTLDEIFGFPSDPELSEDNQESDEEETSYNAAKLQRILEDLDEPNLRSETVRASSSPQLSLPSTPTTSGLRASTTPSVNDGPVLAPVLENESDDENSDEDEDTWKKSSWSGNRPNPEAFDSIPMKPKRMLPSNSRPIRYLVKNFDSEVFELIVTETNRYADQIKAGLKLTPRNCKHSWES